MGFNVQTTTETEEENRTQTETAAGQNQFGGVLTPATPTPGGTGAHVGAVSRDAVASQDAREDQDEDGPSIFDLKHSDFLHDTENDFYLMRDANGSWHEVPPITPGALDRMLKSLGLQQKRLENWKAQIKYFNGRRAIFSRPSEFRVVVDGVPYFNTYRPSKIAPKAGSWDDIHALVLNLVGNDPKGLEYLLDWLAAPLQSLRNHGKPKKMGTAIVFQGEPGSGKGTLDRIIRCLYGEGNVALLGQDALDSRFNGELSDKLFVTANEVISSSNRSMEIANKLKMWITDPEIPVEEKYRGVVTKPNYFNMIFSSNDDRPVIIEKLDRRYIVFLSKKFDRAISKRVHDDIDCDKKMVAAFYEHLLTRQVAIKHGDLYESEARKAIIASSLSSAERFAKEIADDGWLSVAEPWRSAGNPNNPRQSMTDDDGVPSATLLEVCQDFCKRHGIRATSANKIVAALEDVVPGMNQETKRSGGIKMRVWYGLPMHPPADVIPLRTPAEPAGPATPSDACDRSA
jgi:hypothetical protein